MQKEIFEHTALTQKRNSFREREESKSSAEHLNGVIYCRVSSKEQIEGTSLESQEIACKDYAKTHNIKVLRIFVELGESAKVADRTQLIELIDFCRTNKENVQALLVWKLDRFARNVGDHFNIKATLSKYGVRVVSVTEPIDSNPEGKLMETILAGFAQFDNDIRAARTVQGMRRKIQEGIFPWKPPLGYRSAAREGAKKTKPDEPVQPLFALLQKAWKEFVTGAYRKADIRELMDSWGVQTENGITMTAQSLDNLFRNPYYAGILVDPWSGERYPGNHVSMVSIEDFERVQAIIARRNHSVAHQKERLEFPLRGVARCSVCQHYVTGGFSRGRSKRYGYYTCRNQICSSKPGYRIQVIHDEYGAFLEQVTPKPEIMKLLGKRILMTFEKKQLESRNQSDRKRAELRDLDKQMQELIRMRAQGLITDEQFVGQKIKISQRQMTLEETAVHERLNPERIHSSLEEVTQPLSDLRATWSSIPVGFQRRFNSMVVPVGFVIGRYRTAELGPLFTACGESAHANSTVVPLTGENLNRVIQAIQAFAELFGEIREEKKAA